MELYRGGWYRVLMGIMAVLCGISFFSYGGYLQWFAAMAGRRVKSQSEMVEYDWHGLRFYLTSDEDARADILLCALIATYALAALLAILGIVLRLRSNRNGESA